MKVNLSWKLFGFFVKAMVIIVIMIGAVYFSASRDFENFVREFERDRFEAVTGIFGGRINKFSKLGGKFSSH